MVHVSVVKRRERRHQRNLKALAAQDQIARQHAPGSLVAPDIVRACDAIDYGAQLFTTFNDISRNRRWNFDAGTASKEALCAITRVSPAAQKDVTLPRNFFAMQPAF